MKNAFTIISLIFITLSNIYAHNIWIETSTIGKQGKSQSVKVFLGGYGESERDSTKNWFSNTKEFTLWLTSPDGTKKQLTTKAEAIYFEASFTPDKDGVYTLSLSHEVGEVFGSTKYHYFAASQVKVGNSNAGQTNLASANDLNIQTISPLVVAKPATLNVQYKNQNLDKDHASIGAPSGWAKVLEVSKGSLTFDAIWAGLYVAEVSHAEKTEGSLNGKDFKCVQYVATYSFEVGK